MIFQDKSKKVYVVVNLCVIDGCIKHPHVLTAKFYKPRLYKLIQNKLIRCVLILLIQPTKISKKIRFQPDITHYQKGNGESVPKPRIL